MLDKKEFAKRRRQLMRIMGADAIAILPAAAVRYRNRDAEYPFRQDSDFYYLTGFKNRLLVVLQWAWSYMTFKRGARLITEVPPIVPDE